VQFRRPRRKTCSARTPNTTREDAYAPQTNLSLNPHLSPLNYLKRHSFVFEPRGTIEVKGKGSVEAWLLKL
jgi:hypothetical protein